MGFCGGKVDFEVAEAVVEVDEVRGGRAGREVAEGVEFGSITRACGDGVGRASVVDWLLGGK